MRLVTNSSFVLLGQQSLVCLRVISDGKMLTCWSVIMLLPGCYSVAKWCYLLNVYSIYNIHIHTQQFFYFSETCTVNFTVLFIMLAFFIYLFFCNKKKQTHTAFIHKRFVIVYKEKRELNDVIFI